MSHSKWTFFSEAPWQSPQKWDLSTLSEDEIEPALEFILRRPAGWSQPGEPDTYAAYLETVLTEIQKFSAVASASTQRIIDAVLLKRLDIGLALFGHRNMRPLARIRAQLLQDVLRRRYPDLPLEFSAQPTPHNGKRRLGIIIRYFKPFIDNWMLAGFLTGLPRDRYEITLYSVQDVEGRIDSESAKTQAFRTQFMTLIDRYVPLDRASLPETVEAIRRDKQDIILFGNTMQVSTAKAHLVHAYRMAPVQIATTITTSTTGFDNVDYYISAACTEPANAKEHYCETLLLLPEFFYALAFDPLPAIAAEFNSSRHDAAMPDIPPDAPILVSGAGWPKLTPETLELWMSILAQAPDAHLVLYPNSPSWRGGAFAKAQGEIIADRLQRFGIDPKRFHIAEPQGPADILRLVARATLYLDAFPYSGNMSLREPLLMGCPVIIRVTPHQRGMQGAAVLRALGLDDLVTEDNDTYREKVLSLLKDKNAISSLRSRIGAAMKHAAFYDTRSVGNAFADILDSLKS